jgi:exopolysaccharide biosynthesis polyprenyl glycosylphosphotransferase
MKKRIYNALLFLLYPVLDFFVLVGAIISSYYFYRFLEIGRQVYYPRDFVLLISLIASLFTVIILQIVGAYKRESSLLNVEEIKNVVKGISFSFLLFMLVFVLGKYAPSRYALFFSYIFCISLVVIERTVLYHLLPITSAIKGLNKRVLIYGAGELGQTLFRAIANSPKLRITPVGFIDDDPDKMDTVYHQKGVDTSKNISVLGCGREIGKLAKEYDIDEVYIAISNIDYEKLETILDNIRGNNITVSFVPNLYRALIQKVTISKIGNIPLVREEGEETSNPYLFFKRYLDIIMAVLFICLLWPLFAIIALAIKKDSKGPVFFVHDRVGKDGKAFKLYKFRTMFTDTDPYAVNPLDPDDPKITSTGRFLRRTSLDEFPQIINVLKGDMSFVGPRPEMPFIVEEYDEIQKERLKVLPGITGLWQLSGDRKKAIHESMDYDLYYIKNASFFLDFAILIETCFFAFRGI